MVVADWVKPPVEKQVEIIEVEKVVERVRTVTKIKESPDGTRQTIIVEESETQSDRSSSHSERIAPARKDWIVGALFDMSGDQQRYGLDARKRLLLDFYVGGYVTIRDDFKEPVYGVSLSYQF